LTYSVATRARHWRRALAGAEALLALAAHLYAGSAAAQAPGPRFDHTATRFVLTGSHENVPCKGCHALGVFEGTPTECSFCHDGSGMRAESGKSFDHVQTSNRCEDCHTTVTWHQVRFDHIAVSGSCASCHNGVQAEGKPSHHIRTNADCDSCHNTYVWDSVRFDHSGITAACSSCHNGVTATGKPRDHIQTNAECDVCHSTRKWSPASFDHSSVTGSCSTCHDGVTATGKPSNHFITTQDCDECHRTTAWEPDTFRHTSALYPGDHARDLGCKACHPGNSRAVRYTDAPSLAPDCGGCHRNDFERDEHKKHENPDTDYTAAELKDCTGSCHTYEDATLSKIKETRNREHRVSDRDFD
jgi:hypothetical protein